MCCVYMEAQLDTQNQKLKKCLPPKCLLVESSRSDDFRWEIHSSSEKFWKFPFNVGNKGDLSSLVSKKRGLLNGFNIPYCQTNLQMKTFFHCLLAIVKFYEKRKKKEPLDIRC